MSALLITLHHVQLAMPKGGEDTARAFYGGALGLDEVAKPKDLQSRGGVWFESGSVRIHLGVEDPFAPAKKAHPAFMVSSLARAQAQLAEAGIHTTDRESPPGLTRIYITDPFGNRIELVERAT